MRWLERAASMSEVRNAYKVVNQNDELEKQVEKRPCIWEVIANMTNSLTNIKTCNKLVLRFIYKDGYFSQTYKVADWINEDQDRSQCCGCCEYGNDYRVP